jgi:hypothetical protein
MSKSIITIWCDMDGVLVDMDRYIRENLSKAAQGNDAVMWPELQAIPNVYRKMPPTPYAGILWRAILDTKLPNKILTAIPRVTSIPSAEDDKKAWVAEHADSVFRGQPPQVFIGPHSKDKWRHCKFGDILIDDRADNCNAWHDAGGFAILHKGDINETLKRLDFVVDQTAR